METPGPPATPRLIQIAGSRQYTSPDILSPHTVCKSPFEQFRKWWEEVKGDVAEPEAMCLSTCSVSKDANDVVTAVPSSRFVLLKEMDDKGFVFFTNYTSRKSKELDLNPMASLAFYWREVHRQVRVVGRVEKVDSAETERYFKSRPVQSQVGAWTSRQSSVVGEGVVQERFSKLKEKFGEEVPVPEFWGGWRVIPHEIEFWAGKPSRLHDRVRYLRDNEEEWKIERLAP